MNVKKNLNLYEKKLTCKHLTIKLIVRQWLKILVILSVT